MSIAEDLVRILEYEKAEEFILESNKIEGIHRRPTAKEVNAHIKFMALKEITLKDLKAFVKVFQPDAVFRDKVGLDVRVGDYFPPKGGKGIASAMSVLLCHINQPQIPAYTIHREYEKLHPFTDCNGRSGRMVWLWRMRQASLGFLHTWYYQSLKYGR